MRKAFAGNFRIQIFDWRNDSLDTRRDQCVSARRCAAVMCMWFEGNVSRAAASLLACEIERDRLSVLDLFEDIEAFAGNLARRTHNHTTNQWSRTDLPDALSSPAPAHEPSCGDRCRSRWCWFS